uniref:Uncharacterized protein n=1 Tax=Romanomermis culicivorax TaxID=13658 RepID=A0A915J2N6_ROMCU
CFALVLYQIIRSYCRIEPTFFQVFDCDVFDCDVLDCDVLDESIFPNLLSFFVERGSFSSRLTFNEAPIGPKLRLKLGFGFLDDDCTFEILPILDDGASTSLMDNDEPPTASTPPKLRPGFLSRSDAATPCFLSTLTDANFRDIRLLDKKLSGLPSRRRPLIFLAAGE